MTNSKQIIFFEIHPIREKDRDLLPSFLSSFWHSDRMVARGKLFYPAMQEGYIAWRENEMIGLATYEIRGDEMELTLLDSRERTQGVGSRLVEEVIAKAKQADCRRVWLVTTNDNIRAIRFYQKRGFDLVSLHRNALEASRKLKPEIPLTGQEGIPIRHELEFEITLRAPASPG